MLRAGGAQMVYHFMAEDDVRRILRDPEVGVASDADLLTPGEGVPHPRGYGNAVVRIAPTGDVVRWWWRRLVRRSEDPSYFHALRAFAGQIGGGPRVLATLEDGRRSLAVVLAAEASARSGQPMRPA